MNRCVNPHLSRSAIYRCLKRYGVNGREPGDIPQKTAGHFPKNISCGFIHIDLKHLTKLQGKPAYIFVAIDRATRYVHIDIIGKRDAVTVAGCLERFLAAFL